MIAERVAELGPLWHERHVITSYSIHYTKLYDGSARHIRHDASASSTASLT
ncbi:hypothetical protein [Streptomyces cyaneogriseus]|uniref:hypothetical protein n=1 Tax=Streptomyces cyaneogriseus TaxID=68192 RepID=UPI00133147D7|nr:hypothetical protein [Streptomyces cyaneogriseus]